MEIVFQHKRRGKKRMRSFASSGTVKKEVGLMDGVDELL
jgi:hypothetical protein